MSAATEVKVDLDSEDEEEKTNDTTVDLAILQEKQD